MTYLVDTNVISEWRKTSPNRGVVGWFSRVHKDDMFLSVITIGEVRRGIGLLRLRNDHRQAELFEAWLDTTKREFANHLIPVTTEIAEEWGHLASGPSIPTADGLLAATAQVHGWTLVTRNVKNFKGTGVRVENPFTD
jgi:predicted nucleic acid-binding protein